MALTVALIMATATLAQAIRRSSGSAGFLQMSAMATHNSSLTLSEQKGVTNQGSVVWKEYELDGRTFYVNVETGEEQWVRPEIGEIDVKIRTSLLAAGPAIEVRQDLIEASKVFETTAYHRMERGLGASDITLVFQGDVTRMQHLADIARTWQGPISASILLLESEIPLVGQALEASPALKENVDINLCVARDRWFYYPVNTMRNHANRHSRTDYIFIMDGDEDCVQSMEVYRNDLQAAIASSNADPSNTAFIVTSWQWGNESQPASEYPHTKADIARLTRAGKAVCKAADFPQAYSPLGVGLDRWLEEDTAQEVPWHDRYEPYMVVHRETIGTFDERFVGWGGNKAIHILKMHLQRIRWLLLPHVFTFTDESIVDDNATEHSLPADPDLPQRAASELGYGIGCSNCTYKECVVNCLGGMNVKEFLRGSAVSHVFGSDAAPVFKTDAKKG